MISKKMGISPKNDNYARLADYIADAGHEGEKSLMHWCAGCLGDDDYRNGIAEAMDVQTMNTRSKQSKTYHLVISFRPEDEAKLTPEAFKAIEERFAAVAQHSSAPHIASGRPDADDREKLAQFGLQALQKAQTGGEALAAPGAHRTWDLPAGIDIFPNTDLNACTSCGQCAEVCPLGAVSADGAATDRDKCIICAACIKYCPATARMFGNAETRKEYASHLAHAVARKEAVLFL